MLISTLTNGYVVQDDNITTAIKDADELIAYITNKLLLHKTEGVLVKARHHATKVLYINLEVVVNPPEIKK